MDPHKLELKKLLKGSVYFQHYRKGELWYSAEWDDGDGCRTNMQYFPFPVPIADAGDGTFLRTDKALLFMRYIRKQLDLLKAEAGPKQEELLK
jgi:hypothetical protein